MQMFVWNLITFQNILQKTLFFTFLFLFNVFYVIEQQQLKVHIAVVCVCLFLTVKRGLADWSDRLIAAGGAATGIGPRLSSARRERATFIQLSLSLPFLFSLSHLMIRNVASVRDQQTRNILTFFLQDPQREQKK